MTCESCIHNDICPDYYLTNNTENECRYFKNKDISVELQCRVGGEIYVAWGDEILKGVITRVACVQTEIDSEWSCYGRAKISIPNYENSGRTYEFEKHFTLGKDAFLTMKKE